MFADIFQRVTARVLNFRSQHHCKPRYLYVGRDEYFEILNYCGSSHYFVCDGTGSDQIKTFRGLEVIEVNRESFLEAGP